MRVSPQFAEKARVQSDKSGVTDSPETWEMPDSVMMHLFAQERHICARMTAKTTVSELTEMVEMRAMEHNFRIALECAVMVEWCYMREMAVESMMSDLPKTFRVRLSSYYGRLGEIWGQKYEIAKKNYNAPIAHLICSLTNMRVKGEWPRMPELPEGVRLSDLFK